MPAFSPQRILVIRRDNIGDLVCTLPLLSALRTNFPTSFIAAFVNTYTRDVLDENRDVDAVFAYAKGKHRGFGQNLAGLYWDRVRLFWELRSRRFDLAIIAAPGTQSRALGYARMIRPRHILRYADMSATDNAEMHVEYVPNRHAHEVEKVFGILEPLGISGTPPMVRITPSQEAIRRFMAARLAFGPAEGGPWIAIHISARKRSQRWPTVSFREMARRLHADYNARLLLLWAPGSEDNAMHPGDDGKARALQNELKDIPLMAYPTAELPDLIAALSMCDAVFCADGGAMHLAAALGKPIVCLFGDSDPARWRPWGVRQQVLQSPSREVSDISVEDALRAFSSLGIAG